MTVRIHSPFKLNDRLLEQIDLKMNNLQRFFERIKSAEVFLQEPNAGKAKNNVSHKEVALKVHFMRRVLYASERDQDYEQAFAKAANKMRRQLSAYEQEIKLY